MDFNKIDDTIAQDELGVEIPIYGKDGEPDLASDGSQTTITVVGSESARYRRAQDLQTRRLLRTRNNRMEPEDIRSNRIELAASAVVGWHGIESQGLAVECTAENVRAVLRAQYILEQVEAGIADHGARFLARSKTSATS